MLIMGLLLWYAWRRYQRMQPQVTLTDVPPDVARGLRDESPEARGFWKLYESFLEDFDRTGHPFQYRQLVDLMACGPWPLTVQASADLAASRHLARYASDLELRNELGEITAHNLRRVTGRAEYEPLIGLLERLRELAGRNEEALEVWLGPTREHDLAGDCPRRRALAIAVLRRCGTPEMIAEADAQPADAAGLEPFPESTAAPLPPFAELAEFDPRS